MFNRTTLLVLVAAFAAGLGLWLAQKQFTPTPAVDQSAYEAVRLLPEARELPDFSLAAADGGAVTPETLQGRWTIVFIGFTHCPDVCPTTLAELGQAERRWTGKLPEDQHPRILFVSVDPERDTPERTGQYARYFSPTAIGATADVPMLETFAKSLLMVFAKVPLEGDNYTVDHSARLALIDPQGRFAGYINPPLSPAQIADDMTALAGKAQ